MKKLLALSFAGMSFIIGGCASTSHSYHRPPPTGVIIVHDYPPSFVSSYIFWNVRMSDHPHQNRFPYRR